MALQHATVDLIEQQVSKWSLQDYDPVVELTTRLAEASLDGEQMSLKTRTAEKMLQTNDSVKPPKVPATKRAHVAQANDADDEKHYQQLERLYGYTVCRTCKEYLCPPESGWFHERLCPECGRTDYGLEWWNTQVDDDWVVWVCWLHDLQSIVEGISYPPKPFYPPQQFYTRYDALQYGLWMELNNENVESQVHPQHLRLSEDLDGLKDWKRNDLRQTPASAIEEFHRRNHRFIDTAELQSELDELDFQLYHKLEPVSAYSEWDMIVGSNPYHQDNCRYGDNKKTFFRSLVWHRVDDEWLFIRRQKGESDYSLYCRAFGMQDHTLSEPSWKPPVANWAENPAYNANPYDRTVPDFMFAMECRSKFPEAGKYIVLDGWYCWLPQMEYENPSEFEQRAKQMQDSRAIRYKRTNSRSLDPKKWKVEKFKQRVDETLAQFTARFHDVPGEEVHPQKRAGPLLDWCQT